MCRLSKRVAKHRKCGDGGLNFTDNTDNRYNYATFHIDLTAHTALLQQDCLFLEKNAANKRGAKLLCRVSWLPKEKMNVIRSTWSFQSKLINCDGLQELYISANGMTLKIGAGSVRIGYVALAGNACQATVPIYRFANGNKGNLYLTALAATQSLLSTAGKDPIFYVWPKGPCNVLEFPAADCRDIGCTPCQPCRATDELDFLLS
ncbi:unnamed protein product, partial [Mesorhabditis spiculigera]